MNKLHPRAQWLFFINSIISWSVLFGFVILSFWVRADVFSFSASLVWFFYLVIAIFAHIWSKLTYRFYRYELREDGFRKEYGVIWKTYVTIPYDRIQNVDIYRGVLARLLGLSDINIQTAGAHVGRFAEGRLPGLSVTDAEAIRDELIKRAKELRTTQGL